MDLAVDKYFFHYTTREAAFSHILPSGKLRFSTYEAMRDPLENRGWRFTGEWGLDPADPDAPEKEFILFDGAAQAIRRQSRLLALTVDAPGASQERPFSRGFSRARMWEHYGEVHLGVCLVFDQKRLTANLTASVKEQAGLEPYHRAVTYTETGRVDSTLKLGSNRFTSAADAAAYIEDHKDELFFLKTSDWETEYEYRFVTTVEDERPLHVDYGDALEAVIVGGRFPDWERAGAIEACRSAQAEALELDWSLHRPSPIPLQTAAEKDPYDRRRLILGPSREEPTPPDPERPA